MVDILIISVLGLNLGFLIDEFVRFTGGWRLETIKVYGHPIRL